MTVRCTWCGDDPLYTQYHDQEWGVPVRDDLTLFEFLTLEGAQAGLSWITVLRKRETYRSAFHGFKPEKVATMSDAALERCMQNPGLIRNRRKLWATRGNARAFLEVQAQHGSFSQYMWGFVDGKPIQNRWNSLAEVPANTLLSDAISKDLKKRGFSFVGSTIIYAHMQATGMVNDHTTDCFRHKECRALAKSA